MCTVDFGPVFGRELVNGGYKVQVRWVVQIHTVGQVEQIANEIVQLRLVHFLLT